MSDYYSTLEGLSTITQGWVRHFAAADRDIRWLNVERPLTYWLQDNTLIVGIADADGVNGAGERFFGEWKTASTFGKKDWKAVWRKNPQSLTLGVLYEATEPGLRTFTVRKAFKERNGTPTFDHAWFSYSEEELRTWRFELCRIAYEIRGYQEEGAKPWPLNPLACFQYGPSYACTFFEQGCNQNNWDFIPSGSITKPMQPFVQQTLLEAHPHRINGSDLVVLSPTAVDLWLRCREKYRKVYEERIQLPASEAQDAGKDFHAQLAEHYKELAGLPRAKRGSPSGELEDLLQRSIDATQK